MSHKRSHFLLKALMVSYATWVAATGYWWWVRLTVSQEAGHVIFIPDPFFIAAAIVMLVGSVVVPMWAVGHAVFSKSESSSIRWAVAILGVLPLAQAIYFWAPIVA
ncbi:MAG: hypothetical protein QM582_11655 [Micropruina sp.]|uniref:hypothetical protein n=1 Tax=Micropruina sp. TaxID=2737536 RepID=UPI0039E6F01A